MTSIHGRTEGDGKMGFLCSEGRNRIPADTIHIPPHTLCFDSILLCPEKCFVQTCVATITIEVYTISPIFKEVLREVKLPAQGHTASCMIGQVTTRVVKPPRAITF